ncbi:helix-turn-helix domain-containing protein [Kitasatospora sp. NPDC051170]|uniref:helix-turn-helix domain-containing protein n=1 Tax=Kitasatospora sp. NPDC051170 TaxID=3364056 RepID=UPI0037A39BC6
MTENQGWKHSDERHLAITVKGMKVMAHPVRMQLVSLLRVNGPSTATKLAGQLGLNSGATSYHLRQLAAAGFVEEDTERGNARERWWRSVAMLTVWEGEDLADEDVDTAVGFLRAVLATYAHAGQHTLDSFEAMPREWRGATDLSGRMLRLTPAEAEQLALDLNAVLDRYRRHDAQGPVPEGAELVHGIVQVLPDPAPADSGEGPVSSGESSEGEQ